MDPETEFFSFRLLQEIITNKTMEIATIAISIIFMLPPFNISVLSSLIQLFFVPGLNKVYFLSKIRKIPAEFKKIIIST